MIICNSIESQDKIQDTCTINTTWVLLDRDKISSYLYNDLAQDINRSGHNSEANTTQVSLTVINV